MPVHLYGQCADMNPLLELAAEFDLHVVEDAAQAIGAEYSGRRAGSFGDVGCFSFFPTKNLGAFGDAGMCVTRDEQLAERMQLLRTHGAKPKYHHAVVGGNFRLDALQAAVLLVKLPHLDHWTSRRQHNARRYDRLIDAASFGTRVRPPARLPGMRHIYNQYVVRVDRRDDLRRHLFECGVGTEIYYPVPLHMQQCFAYLDNAPADFPNAVEAATSSLAVPVFPELTPEQIDYTVDCIAGFFT